LHAPGATRAGGRKLAAYRSGGVIVAGFPSAALKQISARGAVPKDDRILTGENQRHIENATIRRRSRGRAAAVSGGMKKERPRIGGLEGPQRKKPSPERDCEIIAESGLVVKPGLTRLSKFPLNHDGANWTYNHELRRADRTRVAKLMEGPTASAEV
jgi:hypothetical protein